ncbi:MAG: sulfatase [Deltaproteobacteria bacterium]|nr:sulfatase [Deltaproteobacteria bacterium]
MMGFSSLEKVLGVRGRLRISALLLVLIGLLWPHASWASPNFILILTDDLGWTSLSSSMDKNRPEAMSDFYQTPHIDQLVDRGMRFSNAYAAAPVCSPTRYSIQFGKTPARILRTRSDKPNRVDHSQKSIAHVLKSIDPNYTTAHLGKWHIDHDPGELGYDEHDGLTNNGTGGFVNDNRQWTGSEDKDPKRVDSLTRRAIAFMKDAVERDQPFFLQISHYAVHSNIEYSEEAFSTLGGRDPGAMHSNRGYAAMILDLDESIGDLIAAYEALDLDTNTYLIFASDNGGMPVIPMEVNRGQPYRQGLNSPLLRGKWDLTEGGIRVPFAMAGPGIEAGSQSDTPVISYDLLPTLAELAGSTDDLPADLDGGSLSKVLSDPEAEVSRPVDSLIFHYPHYNRVGMNEPHSAIRQGDYKLIYFPVSKRSLLFDVSQDPGEKMNLADKDPARRAALEKDLAAYLASVGAERPEQASKWKTIGQEGEVRTKFFKRYDAD